MKWLNQFGVSMDAYPYAKNQHRSPIQSWYIVDLTLGITFRIREFLNQINVFMHARTQVKKQLFGIPFGITLGMPRRTWSHLFEMAEQICFFSGCLIRSQKGQKVQKRSKNEIFRVLTKILPIRIYYTFFTWIWKFHCSSNFLQNQMSGENLVLKLWSKNLSFVRYFGLKNPAFWLVLRFLDHNLRNQIFPRHLVLLKVRRALELSYSNEKKYNIYEWIRFLWNPPKPHFWIFSTLVPFL